MSTLAFVSSKTESDFAVAVRNGLSRRGQKKLEAKYFYDDLGSALFEAITVLPEYGLTRADARVLQAHSGEIVDLVGTPTFVAELGSGSGQKTRHVLQAFAARQPYVRYCPIDVSSAALDVCARDLSSIAELHPIEGTYLSGVEQAAATRQASERMLVLFLGSTIGNFERTAAHEFLRDLRDRLQPGDYLLLGADLVKPTAQLLAAYDDPTGVTAAFNLNLLGRANRELGAAFDLRTFEHQVRYDSRLQRVEMHLRSRKAQKVRIPGADCTAEFNIGETIWTESSHKYQPAEIAHMAQDAGFQVEAQWVDREWPFIESLWIAK